MAWYGRRRSGEPRVGARAVIVGLGLVMLGVLTVQTSSAVRDGLERPRRTMDAATANVAMWTSGLTNWSFGFGRDRQADARIAELEAEIRDLHRWKELAETMALRMTRYEELLNLVGETQGQSVVARVVAEERGPFAASRIANAGAANGVRVGYSAVNENGLIGRVVRVGEYTSRILMVSDFNSRVPVMGVQSGDRALMVGDNASGARLLEPETPEKIVEGEIWVASGDDGQVPLGVRVGRARLDADGGWRIELAMHERPVDFVRLVPPPDFAAPEVAPPLGEGLPSPNPQSSLQTAAPRPQQAAPPAAPGAGPAASGPAPAQEGAQ